MANYVFLDAQHAAEIAEMLKFFSIFWSTRVIKLFMTQFKMIHDHALMISYEK